METTSYSTGLLGQGLGLAKVDAQPACCGFAASVAGAFAAASRSFSFTTSARTCASSIGASYTTPSLPNVLMFNDYDWSADVRLEQEAHFARWLGSIRGRRLVIIELGAGTAVARVRMLGERLVAERHPTSLIRVNPDATDEEEPVVPIRLGAAEALQQFEACMSGQPRQR